MRSSTKTVVFTDLVDYTRKTARSSREELQDLINEHAAYTEEVFSPYGGQIVKNLGDSFMALFDSATDALRACLALVSTTLPNRGMSFRASAATGDVLEIDNDYFGEAVNLSARINSLVPPGEAWFANRTRMCMNQSEVAWEPVGLMSFKGVPEKEECFRAVHETQCILNEELKRGVVEEVVSVIRCGEEDLSENRQGKQVVLVGYEVPSAQLMAMLNQLTGVPKSDIWIQVSKIPTAERLACVDQGYNLQIGTASAFEHSYQSAIEAAKEVSNSSSTVFIDFDSTSDMSLGVVGVALPSVPMAQMIDGYSIDLLNTGGWGYNQSKALATLSIHPRKVVIKAFRPGVLVNGVALTIGTESELHKGAIIRIAGNVYRYIADIGGNVYRGVIIGPAWNQMMCNVGDSFAVGRVPGGANDLVLPDRGGFDRMHWMRTAMATTGKTKQMTLDRTLTGRRHMAVRIIRRDVIVASSTHDRLPTYIIRKGAAKLERIRNELPVEVGDMLVVGTHVLSFSRPF